MRRTREIFFGILFAALCVIVVGLLYRSSVLDERAQSLQETIDALVQLGTLTSTAPFTPSPMLTSTPISALTSAPADDSTSTPVSTPERVILRTFHGMYVRATNQEHDWVLKGDATEAHAWETFTLVDQGNDKVALLTDHGMYVRATDEELDWVLKGDATDVQAWEIFTLVDQENGQVALRTHHGMYVRATHEADGWVLKGDARQVKDWEIFTLHAAP